MKLRSLPPVVLMFWLTGALLLGSLQAAASKLGGEFLRSPRFLFALVVLAASGCVVTSLVLLRLAFVEDRSELGYLASFFFTVSVLPLVHGITTPGVVYEPNAATMASVYWSAPLACVWASPQLFRFVPISRALHRRWRRVVLGQHGLTLGFAGLLLVRPNVLTPPTPGPAGRAIAVVTFFFCVALSLRHLGLALVANVPGPAAVGAGYVMAGASVFVYPLAAPYSVGFWLAHALDIVGVFAATIIGWLTFRSPGSLVSLIRPITAQDPASALELGLDRVVRNFVADIDRKDETTRDHVIRTAELALRVGVDMGLPAPKIRALGLGALLHDLGKVGVPSEILTKPGRLTDDEMAAMQQHVLIGAQMIRESQSLAGVETIVRHHHERVDGRGYPDALIGNEIPIEARIVSVCDSFDAMVNSRHYRVGMDVSKAVAILREHQGSQWDGAVVDSLVRLVGDLPKAPKIAGLGTVGRTEVSGGGDLVGPCGCIELDALSGARVGDRTSVTVSVMAR